MSRPGDRRRLLGIAGFGGAAALARWYDDSDIVSPGNLALGDCVDSSVESDDVIAFVRRSCTEPHQAEVVVAGMVGAEQVGDLAHGTAPQLCARTWGADLDEAAATGRYTVEVIAPTGRTAPGEPYLCVLEAYDGARLTAPVRQLATDGASK